MEISNQKLAICLPLTDSKVHTQFFDSFLLMDKPAFVYLRPSFHGPIDAVRNDLVAQALQMNVTHLLFMDTDQTYPSDTISKLLSHDVDVCGCLISRRYPPFDPIVMRMDKEVNKLYRIDDEEIEREELTQVDATGTGCVLFKAEVFKKIPKPWFEFKVNDAGEPVGEDINFCYKLGDAGYKIYVDTSIKVGHLSTLEVSYETYKLYKFMKKMEAKENEVQ